MYPTMTAKRLATWRKAWSIIDKLDSGILNLLAMKATSGNPMVMFFSTVVATRVARRQYLKDVPKNERATRLLYMWPDIPDAKRASLYENILEADGREGEAYLLEYVDAVIRAFLEAKSFDDKNFPKIDYRVSDTQRHQASKDDLEARMGDFWPEMPSCLLADYYGPRPLRPASEFPAEILEKSASLWRKYLHLIIDHESEPAVINGFTCGATGGDTLPIFFSNDAVDRALAPFMKRRVTPDWGELTDEQKLQVYTAALGGGEAVYDFDTVNSTVTAFDAAFSLDEENSDDDDEDGVEEEEDEEV